MRHLYTISTTKFVMIDGAIVLSPPFTPYNRHTGKVGKTLNYFNHFDNLSLTIL